jgi:hypothetical protein
MYVNKLIPDVRQ